MDHRVKTGSGLELTCILLAMVVSVNCLTESGGETRWQLFNQCSQAMLQTYLGHINSRGDPSRLCLTDFAVKVNRFGMFQLQHAQSRKYVCFNRRKRVTIRLAGDSLRCFFIERINELGFTEIESAWEPGQFLGFNSRGRFQDPSTYRLKPRCFSWTKLKRFVPNSRIHSCHRPYKRKTNHTLSMHHEHTLRNLMRSSLLQKIRATKDGPYELRNVTSLQTDT